MRLDLRIPIKVTLDGEEKKRKFKMSSEASASGDESEVLSCVQNPDDLNFRPETKTLVA